MADSEFETNIARFVDKAKDHQEEFITALGEAEVTRLKELTPVVTGNMRSRWHVTERDENGLVIVNDAVYARRVNSGFVGKDSLGREYHQRGRHMVEQVIAETPQIVAQVVEDLKR